MPLNPDTSFNMSIAFRFRLYITLTSLCGLGLLAADQAWLSRRLMDHGLERRASAIADTVVDFTLADLRAGRKPDAKTLQRLADLPGVRAVSIHDPQGTPIVEALSAGADSRHDDAIAFSHGILDAGSGLGTVRLRMSTERIDAATRRLVAHGFILTVLVVLVLGGVSGFMGGCLGRYLEGFARAVKGRTPTGLPVIPSHIHASELEAIDSAFRELAARLKDERDLREEVSRQKEEMASMLVHDLKHPLTVLNTILMIQRDPQMMEDARGRHDEHLRMATRALSRLSAMIEDILHIARLRDPRAEVPKELLRWEGLLEEFDNENRLIVEGAGRRFRIVRDPECLGLLTYANAHLIKRLVGNLILNAIENSPKGAEITLGLGLSSRHPDRVEVWVHNTGSTIPANEIRQVFDCYFTSGKSPRNIGLGLNFCKLAADVHGGILAVASDNNGTRFTLTISHVPPDSPKRAVRDGSTRSVLGTGAEIMRRTVEEG